MTPTDTQLKRALAKMLPEDVSFNGEDYYLKGYIFPLKDTELLHLCWLVEETFGENEINSYFSTLRETGFHWFPHVAWQQRVIALAKVKGVEL